MSARAPIDHDPRWPVVPLASIATKIGSGATPRGGADTYLPIRTNFALVRSQNVFDRFFDRQGLAFISDEQAAELRGVVLEKDDVLLNITGDGVTFGRACMVPGDVLPACVNQHVVRIRADKKRAHPGYILAFLTHREVKGYIESFNAGGSRRAITKGHIESFLVPLPSLPEQRAIASILGALDDKIELNRRMNETLEELARTIFKSWFVDFDPVKARAEGRQPEGMDAETAKLFPSRFVESELGMIPEGWRWIPFAEAGSWVSGGTPNTKNPAYWDGSIPWFSAKSLGPLWLSQSEDRLTDEGVRNGTRLVPRRSVLFIVRGMSLATELRIGITAGNSTLNQDLKAIVDDGTVIPELLLLWLMVHRETIRAKADEAGHGTKRLPTTVLHSHHLCLPSRAGQEALAAGITQVLGRIEASISESRTLAEIRDLLLPKLISGELRVPDAEKLAEAAL